MITILRDDEVLEDLVGTTIPSEVATDVAYRIVGRGAEGTMFASYYAVRSAPEGEVPVVVKLLRPSFCRKLGKTAAVVVKKEAVSLGRLNEHVPPTPFVVRLIDTGTYRTRQGMRSIDLPWITIEYVHGGAQGTTLRQRVRRTIKATGYAFDPQRAARAIACMASGLAAVHEVGVIHRAIAPGSILCCGSGEDEIFKISDFGLARPCGMKETLTTSVVDAVDEGPPELISAESSGIGPWTDVFSLATTIYYLLTGESYFPKSDPRTALQAVTSRERRSVLDGRYLHPDLRTQEQACRSIDFALRWATAASVEERVQEPHALEAMLSPHLRPAARGPLVAEHQAWTKPTVKVARASLADIAPPTVRVASPELNARDQSRSAPPSSETLEHFATSPESSESAWHWSTLHHPGAVGVVRSVSWDGYGRCLAASSEGLLFWNGTGWSRAALEVPLSPDAIRVVHKVGAGRWIVGGDGPTLAVLTTGGIAGVLRRPAEAERCVAMSGDLDDMGVLATAPQSGPPRLHTFVGRRWVRPFTLDGVAHIAGLTRVGDCGWLLACRNTEGCGMLSLFTPLEWRVDDHPVPDVRAFIACCSRADAGVGLAVGADGVAAWVVDGEVRTERVAPGCDLSAVALGADGSAWAAGAGRIWRRSSPDAPPGAGVWEQVWADDARPTPIVSLYIDAGVAFAISADGGILQGRSSQS